MRLWPEEREQFISLSLSTSGKTRDLAEGDSGAAGPGVVL